MTDLLHDPLKGEGVVRTDMYCTNCSKNFIGKLDFSIDGNHTIICPACGHRHYRVIKNGVITSERHDSDASDAGQYLGQWRHDSLAVETTTAAQFLRDRWLNRSE